METIQEVEKSKGVSDEHIEHKVKKGRKSEMKRFKPASLEVLDHVKINVEPETPVSTLKGVIMSKAERPFTKNELKKAEDLMTIAFVEFYHKLRLLKSYW